MKFIRELLETQEEDLPKNPDEELEDTPSDDAVTPVTDESDEDEPDEDSEDDGDEDIGSVSQRQGYEKEKTEMFMFGANRPVTILSKTEEIDDKSILTKYIINPKTGAWVYKIGLSEDDLIEIKNGEDPSSLLKHLKRRTKISLRQISEYFG